MNRADTSVHAIYARLCENLRSYIEAQYHIRNEGMIKERRALLDEPGSVCQVPYIESTPVYELGEEYASLDLPTPVRDCLVELTQLDVGIFKRPYLHQARALQAFFQKDSRDLIVATGTGSGKTESFLMPIIGALADEGRSRPKCAALPGVRALLLYPMNALVNDQNSRIRKLIGDEAASQIVSRGRGRPVRFGTYTGRTPYPGIRTASKDTSRIEPLFERYYLKLLQQSSKVEKLAKIGQWPAKDMAAFFGAQYEEMITTKGGKTQRRRHWEKRLTTGANDRELMTRHETQQSCPDLLVTNYSMLEYMLMRPIERSIFAQTKEWLHSDTANEFIVVLDEAHMYRGAGGAEVALLLRRLIERLGVNRDRVRFILTSASLGDNDEARASIQDFARDLTGLSEHSIRKFELITGTKEARFGEGVGEKSVAAALANFALPIFQDYAKDPLGARKSVTDLALNLGWPPLREDDEISDYLFTNLTGFPPLERLITLVSGKAVKLESLEKELFEVSEASPAATSTLLALASFAKRKYDGRVLLPTRLHTFFRGLPGLHACCNSNCAHGRISRQSDPILGRLFTSGRDECDCGSRTFELFTHRECGGAFLRGYMTNHRGTFVWSNPSGRLREGAQSPLLRVDILVEQVPHKDEALNCMEAWLDVRSGRLAYSEVEATEGFRKVFLPEPAIGGDDESLHFVNCPICADSAFSKGRSEIMDHVTKGEAPFANLVKTQLESQPATVPEGRDIPNGGRKVLLFSDGRQKAARLARDIPREVESDIFRQIVVMAADRLMRENLEARPARNLYIAVLTILRDFNLPMFDRAAAQTIENKVQSLIKDFEGSELSEICAEFEADAPPDRYTVALLKQLCGRYYSLIGATVAYLAPSKKAQRQINSAVAKKSNPLDEHAVEEVCLTWIAEMADRYAFNRDIPDNVRAKAMGYWRPGGGSGRLDKTQLRTLAGATGVTEQDLSSVVDAIRDELGLQSAEDQTWFLDPMKVQIQVAANAPWYLCDHCMTLRPFLVKAHCSSCGSASTRALDPDTSDYIRARKGFWRAPVVAALGGNAVLRGISVEEHTAQLSNRDNAKVHATTEEFELRFRDIRLDDRDRPIDVLSCTTTMEVGVDIGSLVAVGLRNVPPQRENYQQRAGRAGRRGSSVSSVLTFAQNGPHDSFYFADPHNIVAGPPRNPDVKIDNPKIARRHVHSFLLQTYFHDFMDAHAITVGGATSALFRALGTAGEFFHGDVGAMPTFRGFSNWCATDVLDADGAVGQRLVKWLPPDLRIAQETTREWTVAVTKKFLDDLAVIGQEVPRTGLAQVEEGDENDEGKDDAEERQANEVRELLDLLFTKGLLPSYAFPTDLTSFLIERLRKNPSTGYYEMEIKEKPQQSIQKALSEYAPGRLIVVNKETYRSGGVVANVMPTVHDRAAPLFLNDLTLVHCDNCSFVNDIANDLEEGATCPVCKEQLRASRVLRPQVFLPEDGRPLPEDDRDQEITYATAAQFPVPFDGAVPEGLTDIGVRATFAVALDQRLVVTNRGELDRDQFKGFWICEKCGRSSTQEPDHSPHKRPYDIEFSFGQPKPPPKCNGEFRQRFLGHIFSTDLLLVRVDVAPPMDTRTQMTVTLRALEDALHTLSEAFRLSASRHPQLDLDASEFGSGFRIVPRQSEGIHADIYLYDTLSGGAGYSELVGRHLNEILSSALELLEGCPGHCDSSCQYCLRHFHNQHLTSRLDRNLGAAFLRYAMFGTPPREKEVVLQLRSLRALRRMLELDGFSCSDGELVDGIHVPLTVRKGGKSLYVGTRPALVANGRHSLDALGEAGHSIEILNEYIVRQNLPDEHQLIKSKF